MSSKLPAGFAHPLQNHPGHASLLSRGKEGRAAGWAPSLPGSPACSHHLGMAQLPLCSFPCEHTLYPAGGGKLCQVGLNSLLHSTQAHFGRRACFLPGAYSVSTEGTVDQDKKKESICLVVPQPSGELLGCSGEGQVYYLPCL